ncbi:uncharacterized protein LY89DRAFT_687471 [Mollisia scopiformis]|uniref:Uncharacterized protein n=1 Tax=Mollisia scopiformis TaxID=149040 RepID=A0A194X035_MOLSC|nr:uncharacterized protein LY89DRAFT_687471 [Mollisia scopiformis]KUJ13314.1 hypothetical protein LY89DRAFT_687471 [Mollisia scopiformis]
MYLKQEKEFLTSFVHSIAAASWCLRIILGIPSSLILLFPLDHWIGMKSSRTEVKKYTDCGEAQNGTTWKPWL